MKDIINSIKVHMHERSTSPLFGAFVFSWIGWNYKFIMVLLSKKPFTDKFGYIDDTLYPTIFHNLGFGFFLPTITAVAFIYIYPHPAEKVFSFWKSKQRKMNEIRQNIENETLLSVEDSRRIRQELRVIERNHSIELEEKEDSHRRIQQLLVDKEDEVETLKNKLVIIQKTFKEQSEKLKKDINVKLTDNKRLSTEKSSVNEIEKNTARAIFRGVSHEYPSRYLDHIGKFLLELALKKALPIDEVSRFFSHKIDAKIVPEILEHLLLRGIIDLDKDTYTLDRLGYLVLDEFR